MYIVQSIQESQSKLLSILFRNIYRSWIESSVFHHTDLLQEGSGRNLYSFNRMGSDEPKYKNTSTSTQQILQPIPLYKSYQFFHLLIDPERTYKTRRTFPNRESSFWCGNHGSTAMTFPSLPQKAFVTSCLRYQSRTQSSGPQGPELSSAAAAQSGHGFCPPLSYLQWMPVSLTVNML